ncbi:acyl-CoA dehydrogenase family protein [Alkalicoccus daliensis]|uniref:Acyl-CoA dehydrogenase n=1 Tax=Alkalicoccus daliensis TaxID=745820 RepID=A0A1H0KMQ8_9BACI|nr:acyl-CoA dehydrogenase family protein [Alkalicoccus daliensis]SDO57218.1 Acyl-CoA dehydrogenase [Alkalicoccus daliensis]
MNIKDLYNWLELHESTIKEAGMRHDQNGTFPFDNLNLLREAGYTGLTVPESLGGFGADLNEMLHLQQRLAKADGATALSIGWHVGLIYHTGSYDLWKGDHFEKLCAQALKGSLFNTAATEKATGSPTRGGKPETTAVKSGGAWVLNGRKTFTTMAPALDFAAVTATVEETEEVSQFFVPMNTEGIEIEETWDSIAMKGTGSHDLLLTDVKVPLDHKIELTIAEKEIVHGWLLHIPACYLGIAEAAFEYALDFSLSYSPNSLNGTISDTAHVREKLGRMELLYRQSEAVLYDTARKFEEASFEEKRLWKGQLAAAKHTVTNNAVDIVDLAMRITGARSLSRENPLQRYYRDVRAGLHNPPMDDAVISLLAEEAIVHRRQGK